MRVAEARVAGARALVCGTGYTGEDGVELLVAPADAPAIWDALMADGASPVGLGARDTLRLEVCFHLYGNDLSEDRTPVEAGLGWACKLDTAFIGADALRDLDPPERLVPLAAVGEGIPRPGYPVRLAGTDADAGTEGEAEIVGTVTSGTYSPSLERGIAFAYVRADLAAPGTPVDVDVRGRLRRSEVREKPLYRKES
jgi:aminomethyltransferase